MIVRAKMMLTLINVRIQFHTSPKLQFWSLPKRSQSNCWYLWSVVGYTNYQTNSFDPALKSWRTRNPRIVCKMRSIWFRDWCSSKPNGLIASFSQSEAFYLSWIISLKIFGFSPFSGFLMDQKCQKMLLVLTCQDTQTQFSSLLLASFYHQGSIETLLLETDCSFLNIMINILYVETRVLIDQKWQKCYSY